MSPSFSIPHNAPGRMAGFLALAAIAWSNPTHALTFRVGTGTGCTQTTIAAALMAAENSVGPDTIRITRSSSYTQQAITFTTSQELTITGGYADCTTDTEDATYTTIDGAGGVQGTVFTINGNTGSLIRLRKLKISGGDPPSGSSAGGGIYYTGNGLLDIADAYITGNTAAYGGGINAGGTGDSAELDIGANTLITLNTAYYNGGGIFSNNIETVIRGDETLIALNTASGFGGSGGFGGGIHIRACAFDSIVYLGSSGVGAAGVVSNNSAKYGGGIAVEGSTGNCGSSRNAELRMFSTNSTQLTRIQGNTASTSGGGIYLHPSQVTANAYIWGGSIDGNTAPEASAVYLGTADTRASLFINQPTSTVVPPKPDGAVDCAIGIPCGRISDNGGTGSGHVIYGPDRNYIVVDRIEISGNKGSELIRVNVANISNSVIAGNSVTGRLIENNLSTFNDVTIAGNTVGSAETLGINTGGHLSVLRSIIWQPGKLAVHNDGDSPTAQHVISNEIVTLLGMSSFELSTKDPYFVDPAHGDYSLTAGSPAIDELPTDTGNNIDLLNHTRDVNLPYVPDHFGPRDLGALERQASSGMVENGEFDRNVNAWPEVAIGASNWDSTQNVSGTSGSGSLHVNVTTTATGITARKQCIHLPGPGDYALNGWGKSTGTITPGDQVKLYWEFRRFCTDPPSQSGSLLLSSSGTWRRAPSPAHIVFSGSTPDMGLVVYLVVEEGGEIGGVPSTPDTPAGGSLIGWFDGITLEVATDRIFRNGFDGL